MKLISLLWGWCKSCMTQTDWVMVEGVTVCERCGRKVGG